MELVEGGRGLVCEGDPAYLICKELQRVGYSKLILSLPVFASGNVKERRLMDTGQEIDILQLAQATDQMAVLEEGELEVKCVHHWIVAEPENAKSLGKCKFCGEEREFPLHPTVRTNKERFNDRVPEQRLREVWEDYNRRLNDALRLTGGREDRVA